MSKSLWEQIKKSVFGKMRPSKPKLKVYVEATKPDPDYKAPPKPEKPPKSIPVQPALRCPYCQHVFDKVTGSKRRCPSCKGEIVVRTDNKVKVLFTPEGAERFDAERQRRYNRNNLIREYIGWMDGETFDKQKRAVENSTNQTLTDEEFTLRVLNDQLESKETRDDLLLQKTMYYTIARLRHQMRLDPYEAKAAFFRCDLLYRAQQVSYDWKIRVRTGCTCGNCSKVEGKIMTIQDALVKMPLPVKGCEMVIFARYEGYVEDENM